MLCVHIVCTQCVHTCAYCVHVHIVCAHCVVRTHVCVHTCVCMLGVGTHSGRSSEGQGWLCGWAGEGLQGSALRACLPGPAAQLTQAQGERIACRDPEAHGSPWAGTCTGCWCHSDTLTLTSPPGRDEGGRSSGPLLPFDIWSSFASGTPAVFEGPTHNRSLNRCAGASGSRKLRSFT